MRSLRKYPQLKLQRKHRLSFKQPMKMTKAVKDSKLQRLTTSFEEIKMEEDETFDEFYAKLNYAYWKVCIRASCSL